MSNAKASSDTPTAPASSEISAATAPAMDLENLLDSASQDLDTLEEQHQQLIDAVVDPVDIMVAEAKPSTPRETIKQLLCDINVNLDQVTTNEMEHLQAMSLEVCVKCGKVFSKTYCIFCWLFYYIYNVDRIECDPHNNLCGCMQSTRTNLVANNLSNFCVV